MPMASAYNTATASAAGGATTVRNVLNIADYRVGIDGGVTKFEPLSVWPIMRARVTSLCRSLVIGTRRQPQPRPHVPFTRELTRRRAADRGPPLFLLFRGSCSPCLLVLARRPISSFLVIFCGNSGANLCTLGPG